MSSAERGKPPSTVKWKPKQRVSSPLSGTNPVQSNRSHTEAGRGDIFESRCGTSSNQDVLHRIPFMPQLSQSSSPSHLVESPSLFRVLLLALFQNTTTLPIVHLINHNSKLGQNLDWGKSGIVHIWANESHHTSAPRFCPALNVILWNMDRRELSVTLSQMTCFLRRNSCCGCCHLLCHPFSFSGT